MSNPGPPPTIAQPLAPGNFDKAWNDPPLFSYSASAGSHPSSSRHLLNKRVGFPTSQPPPPGQDPTAPPKLHDAGAKPPSSSLPPPPPTSAILPPPPIAPSGDSSVCATAQPSVAVDDTATMFTELTKSNLDSRKCEDINKRLNVMFTAWREGKLNPRIQALVAEVGSKLSLKDISGAEASFVVLSADYGGEIGAQWVLAVRHLLTAVKEKNSDTVVDEGVTKPL
eukprot:GFUD01005742.1.p1 GENE.GFUD01005742.1~~GFUD01005742.1.p1  ORF type:complete len:225 (+),score=84.45 GFUD01005742.1:300-974(+)